MQEIEREGGLGRRKEGWFRGERWGWRRLGKGWGGRQGKKRKERRKKKKRKREKGSIERGMVGGDGWDLDEHKA